MANEVSGARRILHIETDDLENLNNTQIAFDSDGGELSYYNINGFFGYKDNNGEINRFATFDDVVVFDFIYQPQDVLVSVDSGNGVHVSRYGVNIGSDESNSNINVGIGAGDGSNTAYTVSIGTDAGIDMANGGAFKATVIGKESGYRMGYGAGSGDIISIGNYSAQETNGYRCVSIGIGGMVNSSFQSSVSIGHDSMYRSKSEGFGGITNPRNVSIGHRNFTQVDDFIWDGISGDLDGGRCDVGGLHTVIGHDNFRLLNGGRYGTSPTDGKFGVHFATVIGHGNYHKKGGPVGSTDQSGYTYDTLVVGTPNITPESYGLAIGYGHTTGDGRGAPIIDIQPETITMTSDNGELSPNRIGNKLYVDDTYTQIGIGPDYGVGAIGYYRDNVVLGYDTSAFELNHSYYSPSIRVGYNQYTGAVTYGTFIGGNLEFDDATIGGYNYSNGLVLGVNNYFTSGDIPPSSKYVYVGNQNGYILSGAELLSNDSYVSNINSRVVVNPTTTPSTADDGDIYFDDSLNKLFCYDGTSWQPLW